MGEVSINALSGWGSISTRLYLTPEQRRKDVSMPFRAETPFLLYGGYRDDPHE